MNYDAILISGTPASGKDTLTDILIRNNNDLYYFLKHKTSNNIKNVTDEKYTYVSKEKFNNMIKNGEFLQYHNRYGNLYGISRKSINKILAIKKKPVIHIGDYSNLETILKTNTFKTPLIILIYTSEDQTKKRLLTRHPNNSLEVKQRMLAYYEETSSMMKVIKKKNLKFNLFFVNNYNSSDEAANELLVNIQQRDLNGDVTSKVLEELQKVKLSNSI